MTEFELILNPVTGPARRLRIEPTETSDAVWHLVEAEWTGCSWRPIGSEPLASVEIDGDELHSDSGVVHEP